MDLWRLRRHWQSAGAGEMAEGVTGVIEGLVGRLEPLPRLFQVGFGSNDIAPLFYSSQVISEETMRHRVSTFSSSDVPPS